MSTPDLSHELSNQLGDAADAIDQGDSTAVLTEVRATVDRRRRRRQAFAGVAAVGALIASGAVVATLTSSDGTDELVLSAPVTDPADVSSDTAVPDDTTSTGDGALTEAVPVGEPADAPADGEQPVVVTPEAPGVPSNGGAFPVRGASIEYLGDRLSGDEVLNGFPTQIVAWNDGFLSITMVSEPQTLPTELPPEIAEQFPQEVNDLFPDGLPPTIADATEILEEAGLYEVVSEIVLANPDVFDAIYAQPVNTLSTARFSIDGETWEELEVDIPSAALQGRPLGSVGDRLVAVSQEGDSVTVRSSTDLVEWDEQIIAAPERPVDLPEAIRFDLSVGEVAANAERWVLQVSTFGGFDPLTVLEGPLAEQYQTGQVDYETGDDGVVFTVRTGPAGESLSDDEFETTFMPWSDWGLEGEPQTESLFSSRTYTAAWGQAVQESAESSAGRFGGQIVALDDGFVEFGESLRSSPDGVDWVEIDSPFDGYVRWAIATDSGFLVRGGDEIGRTAAFAFDRSDSTWTEVDLSDLPTGSYQENTTAGVALLTDYGDPYELLVAAQVMTADFNGYRFEQRTELGDEPSATYTLTEIESGDVVSTEMLSSDDQFGGNFEFALPVDNLVGDDVPGLRLLDPGTGEELVVIPFDLMMWTQIDANGEPVDDADLSGEFEQEEPIVWIVAAAGDGVVVEQLEIDDEMRFPAGAASNGEIVLVAFSDGTFARVPLS